MNLENFEASLRRKLYRFNCLSLDILREYAVDMVNDVTRQAVDTHLEGCHLCRSELIDLRSQRMADTPQSRQAEPRWQESAQIFLANLMSPFVHEPHAVFRDDSSGGDAPTEMLYTTDDDTLISIDWREDDLGHINVSGQIFAENVGDGGQMRLLDLQGDMQTIITNFDATGGFFIGQLKPGNYQLTFQLTERQIVVPLTL